MFPCEGAIVGMVLSEAFVATSENSYANEQKSKSILFWRLGLLQELSFYSISWAYSENFSVSCSSRCIKS